MSVYHKMVKLAKINSCLVAMIIVVNAYTVGAPLVPKLGFWWQSRHGQAQRLQIKAQTPVHRPKAPIADAVYQPNEVIVPSMLLDQPILEGAQKDMYKILDKGIWRWPLSSTPDRGGNTVILGHRFTYTNPTGVLYHLDKVRIGDTVAVTWNDTKYIYAVTQVQTVPPTDTELVGPTDKPTLTIYTCTPLWSPHNRLVVTAELEKTL